MAGSIFQHYLNKLTDLSTRNKSLYIPKTEGNGVLDLQDLDFLNGETSFEILRKALHGKKKIQLLPELDPRLGEVNQLSKSLSKIAFRDQLTQEETGDQSLFLAWPFVEGKLLNGQSVRAPLILLPCRIEKIDQHWTLIPTDSWQWNSAFLLAYSHAYGIQINSDELYLALEELPTETVAFRVALIKLLEATFSIQLSSKIFEDRILPFPISQISVDKAQFQDGKLVLKTFALIGQFAQKGNFLFNDYEQLIANEPIESLEGLFEKKFYSDEKVPIPRENQLFPVFPLDASQENVLVKVRQGKSLVVEGPPGTGKSQLIANLVSDYSARGKRVLVISQKRAALDVVFERLEKLGIGNFLGLVHDFRADQKPLFQKLKSQIGCIENYQEENRGLDSMQLEREITVLSNTIERLSEKFENFRETLFDSSSAGLSIKAMYLNAAAIKGTDLDAKVTFLALNFEQAKVFEKELILFKSYQERFQDSFWENRTSFSQVRADEFSKIQGILDELGKFKSESIDPLLEDGVFPNIFKEMLLGNVSSGDISGLTTKLQNISNPELAFLLAFFPEEKMKTAIITQWIRRTSKTLQSLELALPKGLNDVEDEFQALSKLQESWWGKYILPFKKRQFPKSISWFEEHGLTFSAKHIQTAKAVLSQIKDLETEMSQLPKVDGLALSFTSLATDLKEIAEAQLWANDWEKVSLLSASFDLGERVLSYEALISSLEALQQSMEDFDIQLARWRIYLSSTQVSQLLFEDMKVIELNLLQVFSELVAFDQLLENWGVEKHSLGKKILAFSASAKAESLSAIFWNGWYLTWIGELERRNPVLAEAGGIKMKQEMAELKDAILEKRKISRFMTLLRLRERMTDSLEFNRLGNRLTYRDLLHQVSKKRQKWPIRKLVEEFESEIFRLIPCWLASPETVSALFPMDQNFDLVIFDEASQCPVERGLPAMLRAKQVVIAGDSRQLRPTDFYQVKWEQAEEGLAFETESLLELAGNFFEKTTLTGHYRSADPGLIHFSNRKFYEEKLEVLPDLATVLAGKSPFSWDKIEGVWESQMNKSEAGAVVKRVKLILASSPDDSIGIVTSNFFQMELIREQLWKSGFHQDLIKVRNIENVQGDEFDQVILSLGYAPNREGKLVTNFGLLGKSGAENRLNVAITRSRKMMHVISSLEPEDFRPSQLKNPGVLLLCEFLDFVRKQAKSPSFDLVDMQANEYEIDWSLKNKLLASDSNYSRQVPSAVMDLLRVDGENLSAILTDDQRFFNSPSAKAAMGYHPILLEAKGWKWEWKWSRLWKSEV